MTSNLERYKADLKKLISDGDMLELAIECECYPEHIPKLEESLKKNAPDIDLKKLLPSFSQTYQSWYSEVKALVKQLLPDRVDDLVRHYEKPKARKEITWENYRIEDFLQGLSVTRGIYKEKVVGPEAAIPHFRQQLAILNAVKARFESSLFDIKTLVQADILDSEIEAARELAKAGYLRAAGAVCGVVIETHLSQVVQKRCVAIPKKNPGISDYIAALKDAGAIDTPQWRFIQHLADIRNICDHKKTADPTTQQIQDLVDGTAKVIKTVF